MFALFLYIPSPEGVRGGTKQNVMMKKIFMYAIIAFVGIALMSCDKDKNNAEDSKTDNPYPYLRVDDLMPLQLLTISQAEEKLAQMGYKGGWQTYTAYEEGKSYQQQDYLYFSDDKKDSIFLFPNSAGIIEEISYNASKGAIPSEAKEWLTHIPEIVTIPERIAKIVGREDISFLLMREWEKGEIFCQTYSEYLAAIKNLSSGMFIDAWWGSGPVPNSAPTGYYGGIYMRYRYVNNTDWANLYVGFEYHEQKDNEPIMPPDAE